MGKAEGLGELWHGHVTAVTVAPDCRRIGEAQFLMSMLEQISEHLYGSKLLFHSLTSGALAYHTRVQHTFSTTKFNTLFPPRTFTRLHHTNIHTFFSPVSHHTNFHILHHTILHSSHTHTFPVTMVFLWTSLCANRTRWQLTCTRNSVTPCIEGFCSTIAAKRMRMTCEKLSLAMCTRHPSYH